MNSISISGMDGRARSPGWVALVLGGIDLIAVGIPLSYNRPLFVLLGAKGMRNSIPLTK